MRADSKRVQRSLGDSSSSLSDWVTTLRVFLTGASETVTFFFTAVRFFGAFATSEPSRRFRLTVVIGPSLDSAETRVLRLAGRDVVSFDASSLLGIRDCV